MSEEEKPVYYTGRHLLQALNNLEDSLLDRPLVLIHGKDLTKPNLVSGIIPAPIPVDKNLVEAKKPSLLALADLLLNPVANGKPSFLDGRRETKTPLVHHRDEIQPIDCPFGQVQRIVTGGIGGIANVHVVKITKGTPHLHQGYDEVYYVLVGTGTITLGEEVHPLQPGSVAVIPAGVMHSLEAGPGQELEFVIFGTPPMAMDDERSMPKEGVVVWDRSLDQQLHKSASSFHFNCL